MRVREAGLSTRLVLKLKFTSLELQFEMNFLKLISACMDTVTWTVYKLVLADGIRRTHQRNVTCYAYHWEGMF